MSVDIYMTVEPQVVSAPCDNPWHEDEGPGYYRCGCDEHGIKHVDVYPVQPLNFSNLNAMSLFRLVGLPDDPGGSLEHKQLPALLQSLLKVLNSEKSRAHEVEEGYIEKSNNSATLFSLGRSDDSILRRAEALQELVSAAYQHGVGIHWS